MEWSHGGRGSEDYIELASACNMSSCCDVDILALRTQFFKAGGAAVGLRSDTTRRMKFVEVGVRIMTSQLQTASMRGLE